MKIAELREKIQEEEQRLSKAQRLFNSCKKEALAALGTLRESESTWFRTQFESNAANLNKLLTESPPFLQGRWEPDRWADYDFKISAPISYLIVGLNQEFPPLSSQEFYAPILIPFIGEGRTVILEGDPEKSIGILQSLVLQIAVMLPHQCRFLLIDPARQGRAFPMQNKLLLARTSSTHLHEDLENVSHDITRLNQSYLNDSVTSFEQLPENTRNNERFEFLFAASFPDGYDRRSIEALQRISRNGPFAGKYLFVQYDSSASLPARDMVFTELFKNPYRLNVDNFHEQSPPNWQTVLLQPPSSDLQKAILDGLNAAKSPEHQMSWEDVGIIDPDDWWKEKSRELVSTPVGISGAENELKVWFGVNREGRPCAHGLLGAMPGSGKSNLYHVLICGLATRYSPDELAFYLVDGKQGVEFQSYRDLPHARVVALHSSPELSRSVLVELRDEMERRNATFKKTSVADLNQYHEAGQPNGKLPRILLMVDEYQEFFEGDRDGFASEYLLQLAQQGRSAGIHMLLGSQRFGVVGMMNQAAIFGSIHLRLAMRMAQADVQALTEFGRTGKQQIALCDLPGKIVVNDQTGDDHANFSGKIAWLESEQRTEIIQQLNEKYKRTVSPEDRQVTIVFDGTEQPNFIWNPRVLLLRNKSTRPTSEEWQKLARRPVHENGLGVSDWFTGEAPLALWLGQEFNIHGHAQCVLRRRENENILIAGGSSPAHYGMLSAILAGITLNLQPKRCEVLIVDGSIPDTPWYESLKDTGRVLLEPAGYKWSFTRDTDEGAEFIESLLREIDVRKSLSSEEILERSTMVLIMTEGEGWPILQQTINKYGIPQSSELGEKLARIYTEGPRLGIHFIATFSTVTTMRQVVNPKHIDRFRHRVALQMSEDDSFFFIKGREASQLQTMGSTPVVALYFDLSGTRKVRFKPYVTNSEPPLEVQLKELSDTIIRWEKN
uniref:DNA segregation ATPase FtsK/SpoIIIE, S-DNA-T family n=1 Tax=Candidatus Kentrum sp. LPFa TaxID=2126335 RepID=A0A450WDL5_9GAMM|nr:MAG: DNA segregation ATPase FtsK/SpoIIIE, S-DNA-T family [Candidatus Kentron sp. LPFa]